MLDLLYRGTVRTPMLIEAQAPAAGAAIEQAIIRGAERYMGGSGVVLQWLVLLTVARRD
ncbi:hypothetical protein [Sabulicella glaciei]|uniref:Uncharacterized protein n=1 Tax=Sabulicella glaciei TaxID=2984948 RepID=A0ABT3NWN8_9PROT|nr:hypothetical protein [Roseococcus sp. MDT2-1-1]MCW8086569.1 hypothetical protein [Roseococcus sp. MDT2-1-1]